MITSEFIIIGTVLESARIENIPESEKLKNMMVWKEAVFVPMLVGSEFWLPRDIHSYSPRVLVVRSLLPVFTLQKVEIRTFNYGSFREGGIVQKMDIVIWN